MPIYTWSTELQIYGQKVKYMANLYAHIWSTELQIYGQNSNTWANRIHAHNIILIIIRASRLKYIHGQTNAHYHVYCGQQTFKYYTGKWLNICNSIMINRASN